MTAHRLVDRAVIRVSATEAGEDPAGFLQGLLTNDVTGALPTYAALLTPQGKAMFDMIVWAGEGGSMLLECEAEAAEELAKRLSLYRLRRKLTIEVAPELGVFWSATDFDGAAPDPRLPELGYRAIAPVGDNHETADDAWLAYRLSLGVAEGRGELGDVLWLETNAAELNGVSFTKGCYIGQENTARMNWRQKVNRRLVILPLEASDEKRRKAAYPPHGKAVDLLRVEAIPAEFVPEWMRLED